MSGDSASLRPLPTSPASPPRRELVSVGPLPLYLSGGGQAPGHLAPLTGASGSVIRFVLGKECHRRFRCNRMIQGLNFRILAQIVSQCNQSKLDTDLRVAPEAEALEAVVELDVAEHGLGFDGAHAPVIESLLAGEPLLGFRLVLIVLVVHLDDPAISLPLIAHASEGASGAVVGAIPADG